MMTTPKPAPPVQQVQPQKQGFRPETEQNEIEGSLSNRDKPGVDAVATPRGRYEKRITDAIGSLWYYYTNERRDLIGAGTVRIKFFINQNGQVEDPQIISNTSNEVLAGCSMQAILKAKIAPPPQELAPNLENGRYPETFSFTIYPYQ